MTTQPKTTLNELALRLDNKQQQASTTCGGTRMFFSNKQRTQQESTSTSTSTTNNIGKMQAFTRKFSPTTKGCLLLVALLAGLNVIVAYGQFDAVASDQQQQQRPQPQPQPQPQLVEQQTSEILVQPNSARRIECQLPSLEKHPKRMFHWNVVRSSTGKVDVLCLRDECPEDSALGIQLKNDSLTGVYDLIIPKVSYDLHDGLYSCYYRDSEHNQTINRDYRLTVLSKYL